VVALYSFLADDAALYADNDEVERIPAVWADARRAELDARLRQDELDAHLSNHANDDLGAWRLLADILPLVVENLERLFAGIGPHIEWLEKQIDIDAHSIIDDCISGFGLSFSADIKASILPTIRPHLKDGFKRCGSPIEKMMLFSLLVTFAIYDIQTAKSFFEADGFLSLGSFGRLGPVFLGQQVTLGQYRVDFLLMGGADRRIVIECDGHDFHSTKSQIQRDKSRDRWLNTHGFMVLRFTGSEIWADTAQCAGEIFDTVKSLSERAE
jgi:very-short-patch-repair endonuclease